MNQYINFFGILNPSFHFLHRRKLNVFFKLQQNPFLKTIILEDASYLGLSSNNGKVQTGIQSANILIK